MSKLSAHLVEQMMLNPPKGMEDWSNFRIEYTNEESSQYPEGLIFLPPWASRDKVEAALNGE